MHIEYLISGDNFLWVLGSFCALNRMPSDPDLLHKAYLSPYSTVTVVQGARASGFKINRKKFRVAQLEQFPLPCLVVVRSAPVPADSAKEVPNGNDSNAQTPPTKIRRKLWRSGSSVWLGRRPSAPGSTSSSCSANAIRCLPPNMRQESKPSRACRWNPNSKRAATATSPTACSPASA